MGLLALAGCHTTTPTPAPAPVVAPPLPPMPPMPPGFTVKANVLAAPALPRATPPGPMVLASWNAVTNPMVEAYGLFYGTLTGDYTNMAEVFAPDTNATVGPLEYSTTYYFSVLSMAINGEESPYSAEVAYTTAHAPETEAALTVQEATNAAGPWSSFLIVYVTNPPAPQMFFRLQSNQVQQATSLAGPWSAVGPPVTTNPPAAPACYKLQISNVTHLQ